MHYVLQEKYANTLKDINTRKYASLEEGGLFTAGRGREDGRLFTGGFESKVN